MSDFPQNIEFRDYPPLQPYEEYKFEVLDSASKVTGTAHVKSIQDGQGKFWHLEDLLVAKESRSQGYGTKLLIHLRQYLWSIHRLRIRVHPAFGQQAMEEIAEGFMQQQYTEEELDTMDRDLVQAMQQPDYWEKQAETIQNTQFDSKRLIEWYRKRDFTVDDPDGRHLWCYPD